MTEEQLQQEIDKHNKIAEEIQTLQAQINVLEQERLIQLGRCRFLKEHLEKPNCDKSEDD